MNEIGLLEVLSIGKGDIKMSFNVADEAEVDRARKLIGDMIRDGYTIVVETPRGLKPVKRFDPHHAVYVISDTPEPDATPAEKKRAERKVPVAGSRAKAVGATAGG